AAILDHGPTALDDTAVIEEPAEDRPVIVLHDERQAMRAVGSDRRRGEVEFAIDAAERRESEIESAPAVSVLLVVGSVPGNEKAAGGGRQVVNPPDTADLHRG